jgi:LmbE family N-acetylglucosaminyl deacetylase
MTLRATTATVALLLSSLLAHGQQPVAQFSDPANLRGERVKPRDGRELPIDQGARGLEQMLRRLNTRASLMLIVAHPDDEDGGMLTYYSRGLGARVAVLTLTRGEGGQNAMTGDFEDALGLLRTQELLSADRYLGVDQFFGTEVDFGFSKTKEEAFKKWTHERVLYDAVRSIRLYRPLVIAAVFIGGVTDGHGQHQVSGQIAQEAFKAAADPTVFPDMIAEGILPWQALKVYARVPMQSISDKGLFDYATGKYTAPRFENYVTGEVSTTVPSSDVIVHEGTTDPILSDNPSDPPRTYVQFARIGLGMQKSQIGGGFRVPPAGAFDVSYHRYGSKLAKQPEHETSFFDGIDTSILSLQEYHTFPTDIVPKLAGSIDDATKKFDLSHPETIAPILANALKICDALVALTQESTSNPAEKANALHELGVKRVQLNDALALALRLTVGASSDSDTAVALTAVPVHIQIVASGKEVPDDFFVAPTPRGEAERAVPCPGPDEPKHFGTSRPFKQPLVRDCTADPDSEVTRPYFTRTDIEQPVYQLLDPNLRNAPATPPAYVLLGEFHYRGALVEVNTVVRHGVQPVQIVPALSVRLSNHAQVLPSTNRSFLVAEDTVPFTPGEDFNLTVPSGWHVSPHPQANPLNEGTISTSLITVDKEPSKPLAIPTFVKLPDGKKYDEGYRPIGYGDLPRTNYYTPATVRIVPVDLNLPATHRIAYLPGTGDAVPEALASIDLKPEILTVADLIPAKLAHYDTVILGVRTYAAHPDLHGAPTQALLDYARNGGNVLVQYQTAEFTAADAPYPLTLGYAAEKVVDETDPVQLIQPDAQFLTTPNKITPADFNTWVEERGHGFLGTWDPHYTALTETHDPDQDPQRGGLITTPLGKGRWTYCAFALYRQLPEAVPGAFRLFVNLITPPAR